MCEPMRNVSKVLLNLFFSNFEISELQEVETLTLSSVIANVGGALGVFLGASVITIIELFVFLSLSVVYTLRHVFRV